MQTKSALQLCQLPCQQRPVHLQSPDPKPDVQQLLVSTVVLVSGASVSSQQSIFSPFDVDTRERHLCQSKWRYSRECLPPFQRYQLEGKPCTFLQCWRGHRILEMGSKQQHRGIWQTIYGLCLSKSECERYNRYSSSNREVRVPRL